MKYNIKTMAAAALAIGAFAACDDDIAEWKLSPLSPSGDIELLAAKKIALSSDNVEKVVLQFAFTTDGHEIYLTNDSAGAALGDGYYFLEISTSENFDSNVKSIAINTSKGSNEVKFTGGELNIIAEELGLKADNASTIYLRIGRSYTSASKLGCVYTSAMDVEVTPFTLDMSKAFVWDKDKSAIIDTVYAIEPGLYAGFMPTKGGWSNFWIKDAKNQMWGNSSVDGFAYASCSSDAWNFWTAEPMGCIYTQLDTRKNGSETISYTALTTLSVGGDATAELSFDANTCKWSGAITTTADNATLTLSSATLTNDNATGDAYASAVAGTMTFGVSGNGTLAIGGTEGITVGTAGKYKLEVNMSFEQIYYELTSLSDVETYPAVVKATVGETTVTLKTHDASGLASGIYTGVINNTAAGGELKFTGDGAEITLDEAITLANAGKTYTIRLDLTTKSAIVYEMAEKLVLYSDKDRTAPLAELMANTATGTYEGLFCTPAETWNFFAMDANGVSFSCNTETWEKSSFVQGTENIWVSNPLVPSFVSFDIANQLWSETAITNMAITGDFTVGEGGSGWNLNSTFTINADGTLTIEGVSLIDEQWGPYILVNFDDGWNCAAKLFLAADGETLTTVEGNMVKPATVPATYDITVDCKTNKISFTTNTGE